MTPDPATRPPLNPGHATRASRGRMSVGSASGLGVKLRGGGGRRINWGRAAVPADPSVSPLHATRSPMDDTPASHPPAPTTARAAGIAATATGPA
jgi:hypothetical protein